MNLITKLIYDYGLVAIFFIIMLEYACFPVSSEIVLPMSGAMASINNTPFLQVLFLSIVAAMIGTSFCYGFGWLGGGAFIAFIKRKFPKSAKSIDASYDRFNKNGPAAVCIGRVIPLVRTYIALIAGAARLDPIRYLSSSFLGVTIWNTMLIVLGYSLRENYSNVTIYYQRYKKNLIPIILTLILLAIFNKFYKSRRKVG